MMRYTLASGMKVPGSSVQFVEELRRSDAEGGHPSPDDPKRLAPIHAHLSKLIAPATPRTILLLHDLSSAKGPLSFLGPVPLVRRFMLTAVFSLVLFLVLSLSEDVKAGSGDMFDTSGVPLLINQLFLLSAASLGATFAALFKANRFIVNGTFDPKYSSSYWIRFVVGLVAGIILAQLAADFVSPDPEAEASALSVLGRPALALLGGFSAQLVYRILNRVVNTIESLFQGNAKEVMTTRIEAVRARADQDLSEARLEFASRLVDLKSDVSSKGDNPELVAQRLDKLIADFLPASEDVEPEGGGQPDRTEPPQTT